MHLLLHGYMPPTMTSVARAAATEKEYTIASSTSLGNVAFHWLSSEHMHLASGFIQLASGFMQLAAAGHRRNIVHFHCLLKGKMLIKH